MVESINENDVEHIFWIIPADNSGELICKDILNIVDQVVLLGNNRILVSKRTIVYKTRS